MITDYFRKRLRDKEREFQANLAGLEGEGRASLALLGGTASRVESTEVQN
jgi:hypothetical protein